jgi:hypothetical protein
MDSRKILIPIWNTLDLAVLWTRRREQLQQNCLTMLHRNIEFAAANNAANHAARRRNGHLPFDRRPDK